MDKLLNQANADVLKHLGLYVSSTCVCGNCMRINRVYRKAEEDDKQARMHKLELSEWRHEALRFINGVRYFLGAPKLDSVKPGEVANAEKCPISNSVIGMYIKSVQTRTKTIEVAGPGGELLFKSQLPIKVQKFLKAFDAGEYPDLVA